MKDVKEYLSGKVYPGRGIVCGLTADGQNIFLAYFIMGRSENSRNRIFEKIESDIRTKAFDENKMKDPSLIIYRPVCHMKDKIIITNGDQTETIYEYFCKDQSFEDALKTRTYEPDDPNFTPRISLLLDYENDLKYKLSIIKRDSGEKPKHCFYEYKPQRGKGHIIHTYFDNADPLPAFEGEPVEIFIPESFEEFTNSIWEGLNEENKISLFTECINVNSKKITSMIKNKNE
ncbi:MAG: IMP cyclohydrolase [Clostridia bacterium]|nr:IMP cyclohydrolase [Clostridia bacterium]